MVQHQADSKNLPLSFSLLWPEGSKKDAVPLSSRAIADLGIDKITEYLLMGNHRTSLLKETTTLLCRDIDTISYRLDIIEDLLSHPALVACFEELTPVIGELRFFVEKPGRDEITPLEDVVWRVRELNFYVESISHLEEAFSSTVPDSVGLRSLHDLVKAVAADPTYRKLVTTLPELVEKISGIKSVMLGVNLNEALLPFEVTLVSVDDKKYTGPSMYKKMVGTREDQGIAQLHSASGIANTTPGLVPLFRDLSQIMDKAIRPLSRALKEFVSLNSHLVIKLQDELLFYTGAVKMIAAFRDAGLPVSRPVLREMGSRGFWARDLYNTNLALHLMSSSTPDTNIASELVTNEFRQNQSGRIVVLTGPNRGGKTTFLQAVGLAQILAQVGLFVPASVAEISLADNVFTHYPAKEDPEKGTGRLGEEAERLREIFENLTRDSLVLLNETLSSTSHGEGLYLAQDLLRILRRLGARAMYATHFHQLAANLHEIHQDTDGDSDLISMVATVDRNDSDGVETILPTFRIVVGPPSGKSYAVELAKRYGISKDQLLEALARKGEI